MIKKNISCDTIRQQYPCLRAANIVQTRVPRPIVVPPRNKPGKLILKKTHFAVSSDLCGCVLRTGPCEYNRI